jgi:hypothetical protein
MQKKFWLPLITCFSLTLSGCLDILEEITIKKDGSGTFVNKMDASKAADMIATMSALDSTGQMGAQMKFTFDSIFDAEWRKYKKVAGISNIKIDTSQPFVYQVSMDFANFNALNTAMIVGKEEIEGLKNLFSFQKGLFERKDHMAGFDLGKITGENDSDETTKEMTREMMKEMTYSMIYNLPNTVKSMSNSSATLTDDKKTVRLKCSFLDLMDKKVGIGNKIVFKN